MADVAAGRDRRTHRNSVVIFLVGEHRQVVPAAANTAIARAGDRPLGISSTHRRENG